VIRTIKQLLALAAVGAVVKSMWPDIVRYLKMRSM
jgi:hypothetical protein